QALETVRGSSRLEGAASQNANSAILHDAGDGRDLFGTLNRAGPRHHHHVTSADLNLPSGGTYSHDRTVGFEDTACELIGRGDLDDLAHALEQFDVAVIDS